MELEVKGHSGCDLQIIREENHLFVEKISHDSSYFSRLKRQAEKQVKASSFEYSNIRIPRVVSFKEDSSCAAIKMEYIYSKNFIEHFESIGSEQIDFFLKSIKTFIDAELEISPITRIPGTVLIDKLTDVRNRITNNPLLKHDKEIEAILKKAEEHFFTILTMDLPIGICHGDLTFSNILFNGNNYYLIDFLDSFVESPLIDLVKIRQDTCFLWSELMYKKEFDKTRLRIIARTMDKYIQDEFSSYGWYNRFYHIFQIMNFLRILQYSKEKSVTVYLKGVLNSLCNGI